MQKNRIDRPEIEDGKLYTISQLSEMFGVKEVTLRVRFKRDKPEYIMQRGLIHLRAEDARRLIEFRKRGRKES